MVLVGCKTDLRKDKEQLRKLRAAQLEPITYLQVGRAPPSLPGPAPGGPAPLHSWGLRDTWAFGFCSGWRGGGPQWPADS